QNIIKTGVTKITQGNIWVKPTMANIEFLPGK
ncbi:unnamed protein product, partial [marine sediment metagenome]